MRRSASIGSKANASMPSSARWARWTAPLMSSWSAGSSDHWRFASYTKGPCQYATCSRSRPRACRDKRAVAPPILSQNSWSLQRMRYELSISIYSCNTSTCCSGQCVLAAYFLRISLKGIFVNSSMNLIWFSIISYDRICFSYSIFNSFEQNSRNSAIGLFIRTRRKTWASSTFGR